MQQNFLQKKYIFECAFVQKRKIKSEWFIIQFKKLEKKILHPKKDEGNKEK
jgi:hypothetical protein